MSILIKSYLCVMRSFVHFIFVSLQQGQQVAFKPNTPRPPLSQYSPELTLDHFVRSLHVLVCSDSHLPWKSCDYIGWTQVLGSPMKSSSNVCCLIDKQRQFSVGCQQYMLTHLMSPVLPITSGATDNRLCHFLRLCEHSCNLIFQFPARIDHTISDCCRPF